VTSRERNSAEQITYLDSNLTLDYSISFYYIFI